MKFITNLKLILATLLVAFGASAWAQSESTLSFTQACGGTGTADDGAVWTVTSDAAESQFDSKAGIHYGTNSKNVQYLELTTSDIPGTVSEVVVNTRDAQAKATISVTVGGVAFTSETATATNSPEDHVFTGTGTGEIIVRVDRGEAMLKALYLKSIKVTYTTAAGTVAKPVFTPNGGSFLGSQEVTITAEEGADIYYTVDGTTPTTESTKYTDAFAITETTTVKAIAVKGDVTSSEATATFTLIPSYSSISAVTALTSNDVFVFTGEALIVAKPTANHVYIQDETGSALLYDSTGEKTAAAEVGKTMAANWSGKVSIYKKLFEIVPDQAIAVKDGDAATVTYPEATAEDITLENVNKVVLLKGITSYSVDGKNLTITIGENEIAGYNQFGLEIAAAEDGKTYEMVGSISRYNDNAQFQPMSIKEAEEPAPAKLFADGKYYLQNAASMKFWGAANSWGTQASLLEHPEYITLIGNEDGTYKMETQVSQGGNKYYFGGEWMDTNTPVSLNITIAREVGENAVTGKPMYLYNIQNAADNLYFYDPGVEGQSLIKTTDFEGSYNAMWVIASEEEVLASLKDATADDPVDATFLIADPRFGRNNRNVSAWTNEGGSALTGGNSDKHSAEKYHGVFNVYQNLANAPAGVYKFTAQGFYRQDGTDNEHLPVFYANEETSTFPVRTGTENSMKDGCASFEAGKYQAEPIFVKVTEAGALTVGAKLEGNTALWCMWDNFALEYYGADADINALKFADYIAQVNELVGEATEMKENPRIAPGTQSLLIQAIENTEDLQTVDDYKTAIDALNAAISQAENDIKNKTAIEGMYTLIESTNVVTEEALTTYKSMADTYNSDWEEGTLTETVVNPYAIAGWRSANAYDDFLLSAWAIGDKQCKDFDTSLYINTWSIEGENDGTEFKVPFFEYFTDASNALGANTLTATIQDLAPGKYVVKAWVRNQPKNGVEAADITGITMQVNDGTAVDVTEGEVKGGFNIGEFAAVGTVDVDGILKVSFNVAEDNNSHWLSFQNVKYEKFNEPTNLDFELSDAIDGSVNTYAKDIAEGKPYANMQEVPGWTIVENGDARAAAVFAYGSDSWVGGAGNTPPASAPEGSEGTKALGIEAVWSATAQYVQPVTLEAGNYIITVPIYNSNGGAQQLTKNLIGFIANDGTEYLAQSTSYPNNEWFIETISFTLDKVTTGCYSIGMSVPNFGNAKVPHLFIDKFDVKYVSAEEIAAAKLAEAQSKANATLDTLVPFGDGLFMYNEAEVNAAREAVANATTAEEVEAIEMPKANAPKEDKTYTFQLKDGGMYMSLNEGTKLAEEATPLSFVAVEGGYAITNGTEYVACTGTGNNNWSMGTSTEPYAWVVTALGDGYYTIAKATATNQCIGVDNTTAGSACYANKGASDKSYWAIVEVEDEVDPNDYTNYIVNADLTGEGGFDATGTKGIDGSGIVKAGNNAQFDFKQTIENLPAGKYKLTAQAAYRYSGSEADEAAAIAESVDTKLATLYATVGEVTTETKVQNRYDGASETDLAGDGAVQVNELWVPNSSNAVKAWFNAGKYVNEVEFNLPADGDVTIGIVKTAQPEAGDYTVIGPWTLTRIGDADPEPEPIDPNLIEIAQDQGKDLDTFTRTEFVEGEDYNTYTCTEGIQVAFKMFDIDVKDCDYVVVKFAEPVEAGWELAFWGHNDQSTVAVPAGATEYKYVFADDPKCAIENDILPQLTMLHLWTGTTPLVAKVAGVYKHIAEVTSETYAVNVTYGNHGIAVADKAEAAEGETVTITVTPDAGYKVDEASFSWGDGQELEFSIIGENQGQFTMPAGIVNISFTFKRNYGSYYIAGNMTDWAVTDAYKMSSNKEVTEEAEEYTFTMDLTTASQFKVVKVDGETQTWIPDGMGNAFGENGEIKADGKYIIRFRPNADGGDDWFEKMITIESAEDPVIANYEFVASEWIAGDPGRISADNVVVNDKANTITVDKAGNNNVALLYKGKDYIVSADNRYFVIKATGLSTEEGKSYLWWLNNKNNGSQIAPNTIYDEDGVTVFAWDLMQVAIAGTLGTEETLFTNGSDWSTTFGMTLADEAVPAVISYIGFQTSIPQPVEEYEYAFDATLWVAGDPGRISADNVVVDVVANTITVDKSGNNNIALVYRTDKMYYVEGADYFVIQGTGLSTEEGKSYLWWLNGANNGTQVAPTFTKVDENGLVTFAWDIAASGIGASFNAAKTYLVGGEGWNTTFGLTLADEAVPAVISYIGFDKSDSDIMTGINGIYAAFGNDGAIYDLAGRRVKNVVKGNLYIVNGKKVLVK